MDYCMSFVIMSSAVMCLYPNQQNVGAKDFHRIKSWCVLPRIVVGTISGVTWGPSYFFVCRSCKMVFLTENPFNHFASFLDAAGIMAEIG